MPLRVTLACPLRIPPRNSREVPTAVPPGIPPGVSAGTSPGGSLTIPVGFFFFRNSSKSSSVIFQGVSVQIFPKVL